MRLLFEIDTKDYNFDGVGLIRPSARCITIKQGLVAMIYSKKYNYYKFPGGGVEKDETNEQALIRETLEEAGLKVLLESIKPFGYVHRIQKSEKEGIDYFLQDNFYYLCDTLPSDEGQKLDGYEKEEGFTLQYVNPTHAIQVNRYENHGRKDLFMLERECKVLEILIKEGYFGK